MANGFDEIQLDSTVSVIVDQAFMWAKVLVSKPQNGGKVPTPNEIRRTLAQNGVTAHIDDEALKEYLRDLPENKSVIVAKAIPAVDGENGKVDYMFEPSSDKKPTVDEETGIVDFKELGTVRNIQKGTLIATIKYNTVGTPGSDVRGAEIKPLPGVAPKFAVGTGTILSNDQTKIYAAEDGNLRWDRDRFVVDTVVNIGGSVDASTGNIDFIGDVVVKGNIIEGYSVKGKHVTVKGSVTNSTVEATLGIELGGAVNSKLVSDGEIKTTFAESCDIKCKLQLTAQSLVNCNVVCEGEVIVSGKKGVIIGGECISYGNVTANQVGSEGYAKTVINLGNTSVLMSKHQVLLDQFKTLSENYKKLKNLYEKLNDLKKIQELTKEQETARKQAFLFIMNERNTLSDMSSKIEQDEKILAQSRKLQLTVKNKCYPGVTLKLFNAMYDNNVECGSLTYYLDSDNEIKFRAAR